MKKFEKMFVPGALRAPETITKSRTFCAAVNFDTPRELILSAYNTAPENQGSRPWCAAYSATSYAENLLWRKRGYKTQLDPQPIYEYAKKIDGFDGDGTYLECALKGLIACGHFDGNVCKVRTFGGAQYGNENGLVDYKYAIHRYGVCLVGMNIDDSWYSPKRGVISGGGTTLGGHAVTGVGYDEEGVLILNSWGGDWGHEGFAYVPNEVFEREFMYGALLTRALDGLY